ncbi:sugar phosphate nucleotidyltransferase [Paenibacillus sp. YYML68]|uniref:sugar phosphate nucleotidyltransferase n=1 Tax=Paenibacillus sp. YYML68 TaxID=2909250 RepID=UPI00248FA65E|nr:sugar phosphate nucleotidyltransferase [Paenibacillus sp. YYML68]
MKGILLAGGNGTRLRPMTRIVNKHLLPVGKYPMIHYAIAKMAEAGIKDVLLITGKHSMGLYAEYVGSGACWGVRVAYLLQEEAGGIAQALGLAEPFVEADDKVLLLLGDNLYEDSLAEAVAAFKQREHGAHVFVKRVPDPERYGVAEVENGVITRIVEKPQEPHSDLAVTGMYLYDSNVFQIVRSLKPSARGELEITDVNNEYARLGQLTYSELRGWWTDAGTHRSLLDAGIRLLGEEEA